MRLSWMACLSLVIAATCVAADDQHSGGDGSLFAGTIAQSIAAVLVFLILFAVLSKFAWGPILKGLQDRENKIKDDLERAEIAAKEAAAALKEYQSQLTQAQAEAGRVIEQGRLDAQKIAAGIKDQTQTQVDQIRLRAEADIAAAKQQAISEIYTQTADLATSLAGRILQREISAEDHQQLVQDSLQALTSGQSSS